MLSVLAASLFLAAADAGVVTPTDNLVTLARTWEQVRLFHPYLYEQDIDWDQAWVRFAPKAESAKTADELNAVIADMLATLHDPVTRVRAVTTPGQARPGPMIELRGGVPIINVWSQAFDTASASGEGAPELARAFKGQPRVVFDLRGTADLWVSVDSLRAEELGPSKDALGPAQRQVVHHGYAHTAGGTAGDYRTVFEETLPMTVKKKAPSTRRYAFVIGPDDPLPTLALAMQRVGEAFIVSTAPTDDRVAVSSIDIELGGLQKATLRTRTLSPPRGFAVDLVVPSGKSPIDAAVALINGKKTVAPAPALTSRPPRVYVDSGYPETPYPSRELRQLAAVRVWMIARRFWAYPHLTSEDYDAVLAAFLPRLADAKDAADYALTLAQMTTHLPDGHTNLSGPVLARQLGQLSPPLEVRVIEGQLMVWTSLPQAMDAGVQRGDLLLEIDGASVAEREARLSKYVTASSPESLRAKLAWTLLNGDEGSRAKLKLKRADGSIKLAEVERNADWLEPLFAAAPGPHYRVLAGNIGFINLVELEPTEVDEAMKAVAGCRAIIFDDRGYPKGTAFTIGPMLDVKHPRGVAQFFEPLVEASSEANSQSRFFLQTLGPPQPPRFTGPTVMLIDDGQSGCRGSDHRVHETW